MGSIVNAVYDGQLNTLDVVRLYQRAHMGQAGTENTFSLLLNGMLQANGIVTVSPGRPGKCRYVYYIYFYF